MALFLGSGKLKTHLPPSYKFYRLSDLEAFIPAVAVALPSAADTADPGALQGCGLAGLFTLPQRTTHSVTCRAQMTEPLAILGWCGALESKG